MDFLQPIELDFLSPPPDEPQSASELDDDLIDAVVMMAQHNNYTTLPAFEPYPWQLQLYAADLENQQIMALCANQVGKTASLAYRLACHLTGIYPDWWPGKRYDRPIRAWAMGVSGEQIRDVLQRHLLGELINRDGTFYDGSGWIRNNLVQAITLYTGTGRLAKDVAIRHIDGGSSSLSFKSYSQGQHALMGNEIDEILIDEEPEDPEIYPQCLVRTANGGLRGEGGCITLGMTPENGVTELVGQFMDERKAGQCLVNATWDDAPHLSAKMREQILAALPAYQRDMRSKGIPLMGTGMIYQIAEERIQVDPFEIPDYYRRLVGIDFGIDHPFAAAWGAYDPDSDVIYVTHIYRESGVTPPVHCRAIRSHGKHIPVTYPHDGDNTEKGTGDSLISNYEDDLNVIGKYFLEKTGNKVEPGIFDIYTRMQTGRFKVFKTCTDWFTEFRRYHRKDGKIVKLDDDLMDATRYMAGMIIDYGEQGNGPAGTVSPAIIERLNRAAG